MPHDSRPNEVHRGAPVRGAATGCLVAASVAVGLLLLLPGLCTLVVAANAGLGPSIWVIAIVAIIAGLALLVGALRIMFAPRQLHGGGPPVAGSPRRGFARRGFARRDRPSAGAWRGRPRARTNAAAAAGCARHWRRTHPVRARAPADPCSPGHATGMIRSRVARRRCRHLDEAGRRTTPIAIARSVSIFRGESTAGRPNHRKSPACCCATWR